MSCPTATPQAAAAPLVHEERALRRVCAHISEHTYIRALSAKVLTRLPLNALIEEGLKLVADKYLAPPENP